MILLYLISVLSEFITPCRLAVCPTMRSPFLLNATMDGRRRPPSAVVMTVGVPPSITATTLFVVPRSMPMSFEKRPKMRSGNWAMCCPQRDHIITLNCGETRRSAELRCKPSGPRTGRWAIRICMTPRGKSSSTRTGAPKRRLNSSRTLPTEQWQ